VRTARQRPNWLDQLLVFARAAFLLLIDRPWLCGRITFSGSDGVVRRIRGLSMFLSNLLRGVSAGALTFACLSHSALAQEALPTIDIGAALLTQTAGGAGGQNGAAHNGKRSEDPTTYRPENASTATKTDTPIMETPVSIQVVPQQVLLDEQATTLARAVDNVSGVRSFDAGYIGGNDQFQIRGFTTPYVYYDGLRVQNGLPGTSSLINVEKVEVLKGPASILYGRADPGGIVNIVTKQPLATPFYAVQQQIGSYDSYRTTLDATGPLTKDETLLYRLTAEIDHAHSFHETDYSRNYFVSPVVRWNIDAATQLTVNFQYSNQVIPFDVGTIAYTKFDPLSRIFGVGPVSFIPRENAFNDPNSAMKPETIKYGYNWSHKFGENWTLTNRLEGLAYRSENFLVVPVGIDPVNLTRLNRVAIANSGVRYSLNTNLDLTGKFYTFGIEHSALIGGDYFFDRAFNPFFGASRIRQSSIDYLFPIHSFTPTKLNLYKDFLPGLTSINREDWFGFYVQDQIKLPYDLFLLAGARYDHAVTHSNAYDGNLEQLGNNSQRVTPRFGLLWRPIPEVSLYGSYLENFGAAGGLSGPAGPTQQILPSETAQQWEVGVKTELFDSRLTATLAYYNLIKQNVATPDPDPVRAALGYRVATGEIRNRGVELDVAGEILPGWKVIGGYSYIDSIVAKDDGVIVDPLGNTVSFNGFAGFTPPDVSRHMGSLFTTYEFQDGDWKGLKFGGGVNARSKSYGDSLNSYHVPGYAIFNLLAAYSWSLYGTKMTAQLNVENLADTRYYPTGNRGQLQIDVGTPRTFKGSIRMEF
jgi:iron complex outermembrane recepter protein